MLLIVVTENLIIPILAPNSTALLAKGMQVAPKTEFNALLYSGDETTYRGTLYPVPQMQNQGKKAFARQSKPDVLNLA